jgi:hypothetical protein
MGIFSVYLHTHILCCFVMFWLILQTFAYAGTPGQRSHTIADPCTNSGELTSG